MPKYEQPVKQNGISPKHSETETELSKLDRHQLFGDGIVFQTMLFYICWICVCPTPRISFHSSQAAFPIMQLLIRLAQS